jgi:hypothetical protein
MIYILRKSKRLAKNTTLKKTLTDAKFYLYNLTAPNFSYSDFYVVGSDYDWELQDLLEFFSKDYLVKVEKPAFDMYYINPEITKPERQSNRTLQNINFYNRLKKKIQNELPEYVVTLAIKNNRIAIELENTILKIDIILDKYLNILDAVIKTTAVEEYNYLSMFEDARKKIDSLLVKQRYYYKKKVKANDHK